MHCDLLTQLTRDQIHRSQEGHPRCFRNKVSDLQREADYSLLYSALLPSHTCSLPRPCTPAHSCIHPSALHGVLGVLLIFFFFFNYEDFGQHFPQQERVPIITDLSHCLMTRANHASSLMRIPDCSPHLPRPPRQEQHPPAPIATSHRAPP